MLLNLEYSPTELLIKFFKLAAMCFSILYTSFELVFVAFVPTRIMLLQHVPYQS